MEFLSPLSSCPDVITVDDDDDDEDRKPSAMVETFDLTQDEEPQHVPPVASWATAGAGPTGSAESTSVASLPDQSTTTSRVTNRKSREDHHDADYQLAIKLQNEECSKMTPGEEENEMYSSDFGQAWKLVERVLKLHERLNDEQGIMSVLAVDDMVFTAERFLKTVGEFVLADKPLVVDVGYHYTTPENLSRIRTDGLLSKTEREKQSIEARHNGSVYGDGIYTAKSPFAFLHHRYGETGLLVVRLAGNSSYRKPQQGYDSVLVNQGLSNEFTVLGTSGQCLPLFTYAGKSISRFEHLISLHPGNSNLFEYAAEIQILVNNFLNEVNLDPGDLSCLLDDSLPDDTNPLPLLANEPSVVPTSANSVPVAAPLSVPFGLDANPSQLAKIFRRVPPLSPPASIVTDRPRASFRRPAIKLAPSQPPLPTVHVPAKHPLNPAVPGAPIMKDRPSVSFRRPDITHAPAQPPLRTGTQAPKVVVHVPAKPSSAKKRARKTESTKKPQRVLKTESNKKLKRAHKTESTKKPQRALKTESTKKPKRKTAESMVYYYAPESLDDQDFKGICRSLRQGTFSILSAECSVCLDVLMNSEHNGKIVRLLGCGHLFHSDCLRNCFKSNRFCPDCRQRLGAPRGKMPSGTMCVSTVDKKEGQDLHCGGYPTCGVLLIEYVFYAEPQKAYHPSPGKLRSAVRQVAYLPNNDEGRGLLSRLKYAFFRGLTFKIGTSPTTGKDNQLTWGTIPHKTDPVSRGEFGFPDANYFKKCHDELDKLGVPTDTTGFTY